MLTRSRILGQKPNKSLKKMFLLAIHSHLYTSLLPWDFYFFKLTQPLIVSTVQLLYAVKEKWGKSNRNPYPFPTFKKSIQKPQVGELSRVCPDTLNEIGNCTFMNSASDKKKDINAAFLKVVVYPAVLNVLRHSLRFIFHYCKQAS